MRVLRSQSLKSDEYDTQDEEEEAGEEEEAEIEPARMTSFLERASVAAAAAAVAAGSAAVEVDEVGEAQKDVPQVAMSTEKSLQQSRN